MGNFARRQNNFSKFGILLALFRVMRRLVETLLFISLAATPAVTAQRPSTEATKNQRRARQVADRFVERFRQTLDLELSGKRFVCRIQLAPSEPTEV